MSKLIVIAIKILFRLLVLFLGFIALDGLHNDPIPDTSRDYYVVIYGNQVDASGIPSKRLQARLKAGIELYINNNIQKIIVSGGIGIEGYDEAIVMKNYLIKHGIDSHHILVDHNGYTSLQTSDNAYALVGDVSIIGVSQWYHISRMKLSLMQSGFTNVRGYAPKYFEQRDFYSILREIPAYIKYYFL